MPDDEITAYRYPGSKRKNNPAAGLAPEGKVREAPKVVFDYNPHLPPVLRFDPSGKSDALPDLLEDARTRRLTEEEIQTLAAALRSRQPWLEWAGKREAQRCAVDPVALHIHERVSAQAILRVAARQDVPRTLFADPEQEYREAVQFYQHDIDWTNRLILGDSLQVMASLAKREDLAGKVQCIYMDPPYGIKYASNFQSEVGKRDVKDKPEDLTRDDQGSRAYRDTWTLGVHSYLAYLRDRLYAAKDLLTDSGSVFVQISDENLHRVRAMMDEVFGPENYCAVIPFVTTSSQTSSLLATVCDFLLWYAKDKATVKFRQLYTAKLSGEVGGTKYRSVELSTGERLSLSVATDIGTGNLASEAKIYRPSPMVSQSGNEGSRTPVHLEGRDRQPNSGYWKTNADGMRRLIISNRLIPEGKSLAYIRYLEDFPVYPIASLWEDTWGCKAGATQSGMWCRLPLKLLSVVSS